jgi:hypothetical protein
VCHGLIFLIINEQTGSTDQSGFDLTDFENGNWLAMATSTFVVFTAFVFENRNFFAFGLAFDRSLDESAFDYGATNDCFVAANHQDFMKRERVTGVARYPINRQGLALSHFELPAAGLDNRVHLESPPNGCIAKGDILCKSCLPVKPLGRKKHGDLDIHGRHW